MTAELCSLLDACPAALVYWADDDQQVWLNKEAQALDPQASDADWLHWLQQSHPLLMAAESKTSTGAATLKLDLPTTGEQQVLVRANPAPGGGLLLSLTAAMPAGASVESPSASGDGTRDQLQSQLSLAVELGQIGLWRHDFGSQRFHYNAQAWSVLGLPPRSDGLSLDEVRNFIHPDDVPAVVAAGQRALDSDQPTDMEARYRRADGSWRHVMTRRVVQRNADGLPVAFVGVAMDITGPRDAALALRSAAERVALVTRSAGMATWELNLQTRQELWDEQMWLLRGHSPQAVAMSSKQKVRAIHPDDRKTAVRRFMQAMASHDTLEYEFRVVWPNGDVRWLAARSKTIPDEAGQPLRRIGVNWDITDSRNAAALRQEAEVAQRESAAKSRFMARVSHELRTPLNAVLGFAQLLLAQESTVDTQQSSQSALRRERLGHIQASGQHLLRLINDLLDLTGLQSGELLINLERVDLAAVFQSCLPMVEPLLLSRGIELLDQVPALHVQADATRLRQVLLNLLSNGVKYNVDQGSLKAIAWAADSWVHLRISDTGVGMNAEQMRDLFEPFNRLGAEHSLVEGTGVGLSIAKALTERMGGRLEAQSTPGLGSSFELTLPAAHPPVAALSATRSRQGPVPTADGAAPRKLLYVEDNPVNALIISELMALRSNWAVHVAANGESGLRYAADELPDLVLLDMQLPDIDGLEVLRRLRAAPATAHIPCLALSANAMPEDIARTLNAGVAAYWTKPLDFAAFMAALDRLFDQQGAPGPGPAPGP